MTVTNAPAARPSWAQDLRLAGVLAVAAMLATAALFPYLLQVLPEAARAPLERIPLPLLIGAQSLQAGVLMGVLSLLGLRMGHGVGLGAPLLQHWLNRRPLPAAAPRPLQAVLLGAGAALLVLLLAALIDPHLPPMVNPPRETGGTRAALNGLLASFYGGIVEELQLRLFLMTLVVWIAAKLRASPRAAVYWLALLLAALLFGAGHLPAAQQIWGLAAVVVSRTLLLNGIAGVVFGWLYWKRGLEMAILAHFSADIVLHVAAPLLGAGA